MLLTRAPLSPKTSFDLHVLGLPPAFVLSQDQTLKLTSMRPKTMEQSSSKAEITRLLCKMRFPASDQSDTGRRRLRIPSLRLHFVKERRTRRPSSPAPSAFASSAVPVAGRPAYSRTTSPASTSFFRPLRNFSEAFRGVGCSPLPHRSVTAPPRRPGFYKSAPTMSNPFFTSPNRSPNP